MKYSNPFKTGSVYISQTYHSGGDNKYAVDFGSKPVGSAVYAMADGVIDATNSKAGSYCRLAVTNSDQKIYYVHVYKYPPQGTKVSKGQKICEVAPKSLNGGYAPHLHLGLQGSYKLMDYMDRSVIFRTNYPGITKDWFKNGSFNWDLHQDLSYSNSPQYNSGDRLEILNQMNLRDANFNDIGDAQKGAVCKVDSYYKEYNGYQYYKVSFGDAVGYMADTTFNEKTSKEVTNLDGSEVIDECEELRKKVAAIELELQDIEKELEIKDTEIERLRKYEEFYVGLSEYIQLKSI